MRSASSRRIARLDDVGRGGDGGRGPEWHQGGGRGTSEINRRTRRLVAGPGTSRGNLTESGRRVAQSCPATMFANPPAIHPGRLLHQRDGRGRCRCERRRQHAERPQCTETGRPGSPRRLTPMGLKPQSRHPVDEQEQSGRSRPPCGDQHRLATRRRCSRTEAADATAEGDQLRRGRGPALGPT